MRTFIQASSLLLFLFVSCDIPISPAKYRKNLIIDIQPFSNISDDDTKYVYQQLTKRYPFVELKKSISLPGFAYYSVRHRYRADSIIQYLTRQTADGHISIGLTDKDISTTKDTIPDWGVMGLGFQPGRSCIASSFRLSKTDRQIQLFKVAIHEVGHTQGLGHCDEKTCYMRDAESKNPTNEETDFCSSCKSKLKDNGLIL